MQGAGVNLQLAFPAPQTRFSTHLNADYIFRNALITLINALMSPKARVSDSKTRVSDSKARAYQPLLACRAREAQKRVDNARLFDSVDLGTSPTDLKSGRAHLSIFMGA